MEKLYYKLIRNNMKHRGFAYRIGTNTDSIPFNDGHCDPGGLYVCEKIIDTSHHACGDIATLSDIENNIEYYALGRQIPDDSTMGWLKSAFKALLNAFSRYLAVCKIPKDTQAVKFIYGTYDNESWLPLIRGNEEFYAMCSERGDLCVRYVYLNGSNKEDRIEWVNPWIFPGPPKIKAHSIDVIKIIDLWDIENIGVGKPFNQLYRNTPKFIRLSTTIHDLKKLQAGKFDEIISTNYINAWENDYAPEHPENMTIAKDLEEGKIDGI